MNNLKKKIKESLKNNKYVWLTFGISIFLFLIIYALKIGRASCRERV